MSHSEVFNRLFNHTESRLRGAHAKATFFNTCLRQVLKKVAFACLICLRQVLNDMVFPVLKLLAAGVEKSSLLVLKLLAAGVE